MTETKQAAAQTTAERFNDHRFGSLEEKVDQILEILHRVVAVENQVGFVRRDVDAAHAVLRAHSESLQASASWQSRADPVIVDLQRISSFVSEPQNGVAVRLSRVEGQLASLLSLVRFMGLTLVGLVVAALSAVASTLWDKLMGGPP